MKKIFFKIITFTFILLLSTNCGSSKGPDLTPDASKKTLSGVPDWFLNTPNNEGYRYTSAESTSRSMQMAIDKATLAASNKLAGQVKSEMNGLIKRTQEETGLDEASSVIDRFSQVQEQVIATSLEDWKVSKQEIEVQKTDTGKIYRAYVLVEWDEGAANKRLLEKIKSNEEVYNAIRATELYEEMEEKVERYRERYGN